MTQEFTETLHHTVHNNSKDPRESRLSDFNCTPAELEELVHDLRQPLSTIECLTYHLELVCADRQTQSHLRHIQEMVLQANYILERAAAGHAH